MTRMDRAFRAVAARVARDGYAVLSLPLSGSVRAEHKLFLLGSRLIRAGYSLTVEGSRETVRRH